jgi:hypothetical protein
MSAVSRTFWRYSEESVMAVLLEGFFDCSASKRSMFLSIVLWFGVCSVWGLLYLYIRLPVSDIIAIIRIITVDFFILE